MKGKMERERITISIKKALLDRIDDTIDGVRVRNRSHAIETLASNALNLSNPKNAVFLIGGEDALQTIPSVEANLKKLSEEGFEKIYIAVGYLGNKIKDKLGNGDKYNVKIEYLEGAEGTGGALLGLKKTFQTTFMVFNNLQNDINVKKLLDFHSKQRASATIITDDLSEMNGLYILEPEVFDFIPKKGFSMLENDVFTRMTSEGKAIVYPLSTGGK